LGLVGATSVIASAARWVLPSGSASAMGGKGGGEGDP